MAEDGQKYRQPATGDEAAVVRVIAIDGPAGSGKTTLARALAARFGLDYLNTGAMYRAVTFAVLQVGGDPQDGSLATSVARSAHIRVEGGASENRGSRHHRRVAQSCCEPGCERCGGDCWGAD